MVQENSKSIFFLSITIQTSFVGFLFYAIGYTIISAAVLLPVIITVLVFLLLDGLVYIVFRKKKYNLAKYSILNLLTSTIFVIVFGFMGSGPGIHYFFLVFTVLPLILFSIKKAITWLSYSSVNTFLFIWAEIYLVEPYMKTDLPEVVLLPFKIVTIILMMVIFCFAIWVLYIANQRSEEELSKQAKTLEEHLKAMEEQEVRLRNAIATKDKFSSIMAHDLNNPVISIMGLSQLLSREIDTLEPEKVQAFAEEIYKSSEKLHNLLTSLTQWSRSQEGSIQLNKESFPLNKLFAQNIELQKLTMDQKELKISSSCDGALMIFADFNMMDTVIRNLLSNAIKFTPKEGSIELSASQDGDTVVIQVSDKGQGMNEEEQAKLFRIDQSFSTEGTEGEKGTGMGLIIVQEFVLKNGGEVSVQSAKSKGTTFTIQLPQFN